MGTRIIRISEDFYEYLKQASKDLGKPISSLNLFDLYAVYKNLYFKKSRKKTRRTTQ